MLDNARDTPDSGFPEHPIGVNFSKTDILVRAVVHSDVFSHALLGYGWWVQGGGTRGKGCDGVGRTVVLHRGTGPGPATTLFPHCNSTVTPLYPVLATVPLYCTG